MEIGSRGSEQYVFSLCGIQIQMAVNVNTNLSALVGVVECMREPLTGWPAWHVTLCA